MQSNQFYRTPLDTSRRSQKISSSVNEYLVLVKIWLTETFPSWANFLNYAIFLKHFIYRPIEVQQLFSCMHASMTRSVGGLVHWSVGNTLLFCVVFGHFWLFLIIYVILFIYKMCNKKYLTKIFRKMILKHKLHV